MVSHTDGVSGFKARAPFLGGQSCTPGWRSQQRKRLASGLEAGRAHAEAPECVKGNYGWQ
jgi:hypothetical protein